MQARPEPDHPCTRRQPLAPWKADHLYVGDSGEVLCGCCMGVESTYMPWAWSDLGPMDAERTVRVDSLVLLCETDRYAVRKS